MAPKDDDLNAFLEMDRFVKLMAAASGPSSIVDVARAYLASWSIERIIRVQATDAGWVPFDEFQQPYPIADTSDLRQIAGSIRIRFRELRASDLKIAPELLELDLFFFIVNENLEVHEPGYDDSGIGEIAHEAWIANLPSSGTEVVAM